MRNRSDDTLKKGWVLKKSWKAAGYTLLEMTMVLTVVGIVMGGSAAAYRIYRQHQTFEQTIISTNQVVDAVADFLVRNGRYPCPARLDAARDNPAYGMEGDCAAVAVNVGECKDGICVEERKADTGFGKPRVRRGAIPFRTLNLIEDLAYDGYGARLQYAVTEPMALPNSDTSQGSISILDGQATPRSLVTPADSAHFLVFSTGPDRKGGYSKDGKQILPCPTAGLDGENCNTDNTNKTAEYRLAGYSTGAGTGHFDDSIKFYSSVETPLWQSADADGINIKDLINAGDGALKNQIGIGLGTDTASALAVTGNVKASGDMLTKQICGPNASDGCFAPTLITDNNLVPVVKGLMCPPGQVVARIINGGVQCTASPIAAVCPPGKFVKGVKNADGQLLLDCGGAYRDCDPLDRYMSCRGADAQTRQLPTGTHGQFFDLHMEDLTPESPFDYTMTENFQCQDGEWVFLGDNQYGTPPGVCACVHFDETLDVGCPNFSGDPRIEETFFTGTRVVHRDIRTSSDGNPYNVCTQFPQIEEVLSDTCQCHPGKLTEQRPCPNGVDGTITYELEWICNPDGKDGMIVGFYDAGGNTHPGYGWNEVPGSSTCDCAADHEEEDFSCLPGYTGSVRKERDRQCPSGVFSDWTPVPGGDSCVCSGAPETQDFPCQFGHTGSIKKTRTFDCATNTFSNWTDVPGGNSCVCALGPETRAVFCDPGFVGSKTEQRAFDCASAAYGSWTPVSEECSPGSNKWTPTSGTTGPFPNALPTKAGYGCNPATDAPRACSKGATGGYEHYTSCSCQ